MSEWNSIEKINLLRLIYFDVRGDKQGSENWQNIFPEVSWPRRNSHFYFIYCKIGGEPSRRFRLRIRRFTLVFTVYFRFIIWKFTTALDSKTCAVLGLFRVIRFGFKHVEWRLLTESSDLTIAPESYSNLSEMAKVPVSLLS